MPRELINRRKRTLPQTLVLEERPREIAPHKGQQEEDGHGGDDVDGGNLPEELLDRGREARVCHGEVDAAVDGGEGEEQNEEDGAAEDELHDLIRVDLAVARVLEVSCGSRKGVVEVLIRVAHLIVVRMEELGLLEISINGRDGCDDTLPSLDISDQKIRCRRPRLDLDPFSDVHTIRNIPRVVVRMVVVPVGKHAALEPLPLPSPCSRDDAKSRWQDFSNP